VEEITAVEQNVDRLISFCKRLQEENLALRNRENNLLKERSQLLEKNEMARSRVESMISRLKAMDNQR